MIDLLIDQLIDYFYNRLDESFRIDESIDQFNCFDWFIDRFMCYIDQLSKWGYFNVMNWLLHLVRIDWLIFQCEYFVRNVSEPGAEDYQEDGGKRKRRCGKELVTAPNMIKHLQYHDKSIHRWVPRSTFPRSGSICC